MSAGCQQSNASTESAADSLLAATALKNDLVLVTRNVKDLVDLPVDIFNPWSN